MVLNPLLLPPVMFALIAIGSGQSEAHISRTILVSIMMYLVIPFGYIIALLRLGRIESVEARSRSKREGPLFVGASLMIFAVPAMAFGFESTREIFLIVSSILALNAVLIALITTRFKVSIHSYGAAGFFSIPLMLVGLSFLPSMPGGIWFFSLSFFFIPVVAWARIASKAHTRDQVKWGILLGLLLPPVEVWLFSLIL
ncbi:MAG TPA: hypothetical protein DCY57_08735 [Bacteroidetes bacterium]|jgi:hypothetical protein|nr:hypothetical protein [Bacteroidota bacterium]